MCMPYWEYELTMKECEKIAEEEKKQQDAQQGKYRPPSMNQYQRQTNQMMHGYQNRTPSMPSMPKIQTPKI